MGKITFFICLLSCIAIASATIDYIDLPFTKASDDDNMFGPGVSEVYAASNNLILGFTTDHSAASNVSRCVWRIGSDGRITRIVSKMYADRSFLLVNNGEWMGVGIPSSKLTLFRLNSDDEIVDETTLNYNSDIFLLQDDNSVVIYTGGFISTLLYTEPGVWTLAEDKKIQKSISVGFPFPALWTYKNTLAFRSADNFVSVYTRTNDGGWALESTFDSKYHGTVGTVMYNGVDTVFIINTAEAFDTAIATGYVAIYTKVESEWISQVVTADQMPVTQVPLIGYTSRNIINKNTLLLPAIYDNNEGKRALLGQISFGALLFLQRGSDNIWRTVAKSSFNGNIGPFGNAALITNDYIVTTYANFTGQEDPFEAPLAFYSYSLCRFAAPDVTCLEYQSDTCEFDSTAGLEQVYTVNSDPQCGAVSASIGRFKYALYNISLSVNFHKSLADSSSCDATFMCSPPAAPLNNPVATPVNTPVDNTTPIGDTPAENPPVDDVDTPAIDAPVAAPIDTGSNAPTTAGSIPIASTPTRAPSSKHTSGSAGSTVGLLSVLALISFL